MRLIHRYLVFFLAGIMTYALSGIVLIFIDTDRFKNARAIETTVDLNLNGTQLSKALDLKNLAIEKEENGMYYFKEGTYELATGKAAYTVTELPFVLDKMAKLLKVKIAEPLFFLNIFFWCFLIILCSFLDLYVHSVHIRL